jgi:hypothetical protein
MLTAGLVSEAVAESAGDGLVSEVVVESAGDGQAEDNAVVLP